jgi:hypothetical protein
MNIPAWIHADPQITNNQSGRTEEIQKKKQLVYLWNMYFNVPVNITTWKNAGMHYERTTLQV